MTVPSIPNPVTAITPSKETLSKFWKILGWILVFGVLAAIVYFIFFLRNISWKEIKRLIALESAKYPDADKVSVEHILLQGTKEILLNSNLNVQAREFATAHKLPMERVVVDSAINMAQNLKLIPTLQAAVVGSGSGGPQPNNTATV